jgi:citrate synthase
MKNDLLVKLQQSISKNSTIPANLYDWYNVKRGLRNKDGTGVLVGLTEIGDVHGYILDEGEKIPDDGRLRYRGISIQDIVKGFQKEGRSGFEEVIYLLLCGELPNQEVLTKFKQMLASSYELPSGFLENMILKSPSPDIMNMLARCTLAMYSYDNNPDDTSIENVLDQCLKMIAQFPTMVAYAYQAKCHYFENKSLHIHKPIKDAGHAGNLLHLIRPNNKYTKLEAELLDLALVLHAEHGGGNNSSFTVNVVSSSGTDTYSAIAAAIGSLKGPRHGGASIRVHTMMQEIKKNVGDWSNKKEVEDYIVKILRKEAGDRSGLVYGIGHAVYTVSDPRAVLLKEKASKLAKEIGREEELNLYNLIAELTPIVFADVKGSSKVISPNVDFYSGFVYSMLNIPSELYTPIFAVARVAGWCAHRLEELISNSRIIRPAYRNVLNKKEYIPIPER